MLPIDSTMFPALPTKEALLMIDFQNDFVSKDAVIPVSSESDELIERAAKLAVGFREVGLVIWVQSQFQSPRRPPAHVVVARDDNNSKAPPPPSPAAFLSSKTPTCVVRGSPGWELAAPLKKIVDPKRDILLMKSHYSAFEGTRLLQILRSNLVTRLYVCGSLANVGVHATAADAATHGYVIALVEDCCGCAGREGGVGAAIADVVDASGCDVIRARTIVPSMAPEEARVKYEKITEGLGNSGQGAIQADDGLECDSDAADDDIAEFKSSYVKARLPRIRGSPRPAGADSSPAVAAPSRGYGAEKAGSVKVRSGVSAASGPSKKRDGADARDDKPAEKIEVIQAKMDSLALSSPGREKERQKPTPPGKTSIADPSPQSVRGGSAPARPATGAAARPGGVWDEEVGRGDAAGDSKRRRVPSERVNTPAASSKAPGRGAPAGKVSKPEAEDVKPPLKEKSPEPIPAAASPPEPTGAPSASLEPRESSPSESKADKKTPPRRESEPLCEGDTKVFYDVLPPALEHDAFDKLKDEVEWQTMSHLGGEVPRLIGVQGTVAPDGSHPVYRHPADESPPLKPFSPTVTALKKVVEEHLGHEVNHVLIQLYRGGKDYISEHSDKTLDIAPGSYIANLSLGAERMMIFRTKKPQKEQSPSTDSPTTTAAPGTPEPPTGKSEKEPPSADDTASPTTTATSTPATPGTPASPPAKRTKNAAAAAPPVRESQRAQLPHNSLLRMGLKTNATWLHAIRQDKRIDAEKTPAELAFDGARISLTFRLVGTFLDEREEHIWGQGAKGKTAAGKAAVLNGDEAEGERMIRAFGVENRSGSEFEWEKWYGEGFDVLHMRRN